MRSLLGLESRFVWLHGVSFACVKFSFLLSLATQATSPCASESKVWTLSRWSCKATVRLTGKSMFAPPKMIAPSWLKVVADGQNVATRGLSIGLLLASTDDIMELLLLLTREMHSIVGRA